MKSFWLELKSICKSFKFLALILVLIAYQFVLLVQFENASIITENQELQNNLAYKRKSESWLRYWQNQEKELINLGRASHGHSPETIEYHLDWYQYEHKLAVKISESSVSKDWPAYNRYQAEKGLFDWGIHEALIDWSNRYTSFRTPEQYFGKKWGLYLTMIEEREFTSLPLWVFENRVLYPAEHAAFSTAYHLQLLEKDLPPAGPYDKSPWAFLFNFLRQGLPKVLAILVLLMTVNLLHREKNFGAIKTSLLRPKSRCRYLFRKVSLGFVSSIILITIPQFLMFLILGFKYGFSGFNLPVLVNKYVFHWSLSSEYARLVRWSRSHLLVGLSQYLRSFTGYCALDRLNFIPLWKYLGLAFILLALFVFFCSVLGMLISILVKNEIVAQVVAVGIFALGTSFGRIWPGLRTTVWDLFSKANIIPLLEGNHCSTYWQSIAALGIASIILFALGTLIFRKQDIISN